MSGSCWQGGPAIPASAGQPSRRVRICLPVPAHTVRRTAEEELDQSASRSRSAIGTPTLQGRASGRTRDNDGLLPAPLPDGRTGFLAMGKRPYRLARPGTLTGRPPMRLERSHPWGFDDGDPRLELRRAAAEAQRDVAAAELPDADDLPLADNHRLTRRNGSFLGSSGRRNRWHRR